MHHRQELSKQELLEEVQYIRILVAAKRGVRLYVTTIRVYIIERMDEENEYWTFNAHQAVAAYNKPLKKK